MESLIPNINNNLQKINAANDVITDNIYKDEQRNTIKNAGINWMKNDNGHKRKDLRKNKIIDFIKGHNVVNIKDIAASITGCSEKTIQRELISLINEAKVKKIGERRWTKYSIA